MPYKTLLLIISVLLLQSCKQQPQEPQITAKALLDSTIFYKDTEIDGTLWFMK